MRAGTGHGEVTRRAQCPLAAEAGVCVTGLDDTAPQWAATLLLGDRPHALSYGAAAPAAPVNPDRSPDSGQNQHSIMKVREAIPTTSFHLQAFNAHFPSQHVCLHQNQ
ncbi:hypothetical protein ACFU8I_00320 [Streptomyces sp. NPDC057540]|uniref:hypothetical protein n=1 Tax=Streptomyces sp. NPDC057540 TaxID=3346160 RepID=UPI0036BBAB1F